ncbi:MAG: hypothetical protein R2789_18725 [Microthrixaceae bacterium]
MIDIVIAAAGLPGADTSGQWVAVGHSQGGHAALAARELAGTRAPNWIWQLPWRWLPAFSRTAPGDRPTEP